MKNLGLSKKQTNGYLGFSGSEICSPVLSVDMVDAEDCDAGRIVLLFVVFLRCFHPSSCLPYQRNHSTCNVYCFVLFYLFNKYNAF
jgi:hypothetical protein